MILRRLDQEFPGDVPLHLIMDNYPQARESYGLVEVSSPVVRHFVPTGSSWMNLVERWFGHLDNKAIKRGIFLIDSRSGGASGHSLSH